MSYRHRSVMRVVRAIASVAAAILFVQFSSDSNVAAVSGYCLQCLTNGDPSCVRNCNCYCNEPALAPAVSGCNPDGSANVTCQGYVDGVWRFGSGGCQEQECCGESSESCTQDSQCCDGLVCNQTMGQCSTNPSPILINLDGNTRNYRLTGLAGGVNFDLNTDGVAERLAWTRGDSSIAFLCTRSKPQWQHRRWQ